MHLGLTCGVFSKKIGLTCIVEFVTDLLGIFHHYTFSVSKMGLDLEEYWDNIDGPPKRQVYMLIVSLLMSIVLSLFF